MFATKLDMFSIGTITVPTHTEPIPKHVLPNIIVAKPILKQPIIPIDVLVVKYHLILSNDIYLKLFPPRGWRNDC
jgi:hypothetical protein